MIYDIMLEKENGLNIDFALTNTLYMQLTLKKKETTMEHGIIKHYILKYGIFL